MICNTIFVSSALKLIPVRRHCSYVQSNPFKIIAGIGIPAIATIFYGQTGKEHVNMQMKILHTRVFGQFSVVCTLLGVMGLKASYSRIKNHR
jgi:hypothetical protein